MSVPVFSQQLSSYGADRAADHYRRGLIECVYAKLWPLDDAAASNAVEVSRFVAKGVPLWAWIVCSVDQVLDAKAIAECAKEPWIRGLLLDIDKPLEGQKLDTIIAAAKATKLPVRAACGGSQTSSHIEFDYRGLDRAGIPVSWEAYFDSGEGADPATSVAELYRSSFVLEGREYRHRWGTAYGWGKVTRALGPTAIFDSYRVPGTLDAWFKTSPRAWGWSVVDGALFRQASMTSASGLLLGKAAYKNIGVVLDTTRGANDKRTPAEWATVAASARVKGSAKRPVSVYLAETTSDDVLAAIAGASA